jgi:hypothetical protein
MTRRSVSNEKERCVSAMPGKDFENCGCVVRRRAIIESQRDEWLRRPDPPQNLRKDRGQHIERPEWLPSQQADGSDDGSKCSENESPPSAGDFTDRRRRSYRAQAETASWNGGSRPRTSGSR